MNSVASVSAVPVMPPSFSYRRKKFCSVIVARVWFSSWMRTPSLASTAWCRPSDQRRPSRVRPVGWPLVGSWSALRPAPAPEHAPGEPVDDPDLVVDHRVVDVALVQRLGLQRLQEVVDEVAVLGAVQVVDAQEALGLLDAALGDRDRLLLLVDLEVEVGHELLLG